MVRTVISNVQGMITNYEKTGQINPSRLSKKIESLKDHIRHLKDLKRQAGRQLTARKPGMAGYDKYNTRYQEASQKIQEAEALKSRAIQVRNEFGERPPAEPTPQPKQTPPPPRYYVDGVEVAGYVKDAEGNVRDVIPLETRHPRYVDGYSENERYVQPLGDYYERHARRKAKEMAEPPEDVQKAGQFVDVLNVERQVLIGEETEEGWSVRPNPNITLPDPMKSLVEERLTESGFEKRGDAFFYARPKGPDVTVREPFDFSKEGGWTGFERPVKFVDVPFTNERSRGEIIVLPDKVKDVLGIPRDWNVDKAAYEREQFLGRSMGDPRTPAWPKSPLVSYDDPRLGAAERERPPTIREYSYPTSKQGILETGMVKFYETDYSAGLERGMREVEDQTGFYLKDTPIGEVRPSGVVGWLADVGETTVKVGVSVGSLGLATVKTAEFTYKERTGGVVIPRERLEAASDFGASLAYLQLVPIYVATLAPSFMGGATKTVVVDSVTGKAIGAAKASKGAVFTKGGVKSYFGQGVEMITPKGHPAYNRILVEGFGAKLKGAAATVKPITAIGKSSLKMGAATGGVQTSFDILATGAPDFEKTKYAFLGGAVVGFGLGTFQQVKPTLTYMGRSVKSHIDETFSINRALDRTFVAGGKAMQDVKLYKMLAQTPTKDLATVPMSSPIYVQADIIGSSKAAFGFGTMQKIAVKVPYTTPRFLPPPTSVISGPKANLFEQKSPKESFPRQRFKQKQTVQVGELPKTLPPATLAAQSSFFEPTESFRQREMRLEIIEDAVAREAGRTKTERVQAWKEGIKTGQSFGTLQKFRLNTRLRVGEGVTDRPLPPTPTIKFGEITTPRFKMSARARFKPPGEVFIGLAIPDLGFPSDGGRTGDLDKVLSGRTSYSPSLFGVLLGREEKKIQKMYSGFEIRGLRKKKKRRK